MAVRLGIQTNEKKSNQCQSWTTGDCFAIPLLNGMSLLGQVLSDEPAALNSASCALFDQKFESESNITPDLGRLFSTVLTTRDLLDSGTWRVVGASEIKVPRSQFPFESLRECGFIGAKVIGSKNISEFANALCGFTLWDDWADPQYLDRLLISSFNKPTTVRYKNNSEQVKGVRESAGE